MESNFLNAPHIIRLRGPWTRAVEGVEGEHRVTIPSDWSQDLGSDFDGTATYGRAFNRPPNLPAEERVRLTLHEIIGDAEIWLNDECLGRAAWPAHPHQFDLTGKLTPSNQLRIEVTALPSHELERRQPGHGQLPGGIVGEVHLEFG